MSGTSPTNSSSPWRLGSSCSRYRGIRSGPIRSRRGLRRRRQRDRQRFAVHRCAAVRTRGTRRRNRHVPPAEMCSRDLVPHRSSLLGGAEYGRHGAHPVDEGRPRPRRAPPRAHSRGIGRGAVEKHTGLEAGEARSEAQVLPESECEVRLAHCPADVEVAGIGTEDRFIPIRAGVHHHQPVAGGIDCPPSSTSVVVVRANALIGVTQRRHSSTAATDNDGSFAHRFL